MHVYEVRPPQRQPRRLFWILRDNHTERHSAWFAQLTPDEFNDVDIVIHCLPLVSHCLSEYVHRSGFASSPLRIRENDAGAGAAFRQIAKLSRGAYLSFDLASAVLCAVAFGFLISGINGVGHHHPVLVVIIELIGAALAGSLMVRRQTSLTMPLFPVDLFKRPVFALSAKANWRAATPRFASFARRSSTGATHGLRRTAAT